MNEKGHIEEEQFDVCGIRMDKDINGQDVFRTAGIAQESFQCSFIKSQLPAKGKLKDVEQDETVRNRICLAFDCRTMPNKIEGTLPFDLSDQADENEAENYSFKKITLTNNTTILPSTLLSDTVWVTYIIRLLDLETMTDTTTEVSTTEKEKADLLLIKLLCEQFKVHMKNRVKQSAKKNHWILRFAFKNLPIIAVTMILSKHLKLDLKCLDESECLLSSNVNQFIPCLAFPKQEGAYLYFDVNRGVFIRSGKVVRHGFQSRHDEHLAASKEEKSSSHFNFMYPSKEGKRKEKRDKLGCFKHLT